MNSRKISAVLEGMKQASSTDQSNMRKSVTSNSGERVALRRKSSALSALASAPAPEKPAKTGHQIKFDTGDTGFLTPSESSSGEHSNHRGLTRKEKKKQLQLKYKEWAKKRDAGTRVVDHITVRPAAFRMPIDLYILGFVAGINSLLVGYYPQTMRAIIVNVGHQYEMTGATLTLLKYLLFAVMISSCFLAGVIGDAIGRRTVLVICAGMVFFGAVLASGIVELIENQWIVLVGLFICALPVGIQQVTALCYIVECSTPSNRGVTFAFNQFSVFAGGVFVILVDYVALNRTNEFQWRWRLAIVCLMAIPMLMFTRALPESPRWAISMRNHYEGYQSLQIFRQVKFVVIREYSSILYMTYADPVIFNPMKRIKKMFTTPHVRRALLVCLVLVGMGPLCGGNAGIALIKTNNRFIIDGVSMSAQFTKSLLSAGLALLFLIALFWVPDVVGRKKAMLFGFGGMALGIAAISGSIYFNQTNSPAASKSYVEPEDADECNQYSTCFDCTIPMENKDSVAIDGCGFCSLGVSGAATKASCVKIDLSNTSGGHFALRGPCSYANIGDTGANDKIDSYSMWYWTCPSRFSLSQFAQTVYFAFFLPFVDLASFTFMSEVPPQWSRTMFIGICLCARNLVAFIDDEWIKHNEFRQIGFFQSMVFYVMFCLMGIVFVFLFVPETRGRPVEFLDLLFMRRTKRRGIAKRRNKMIAERMLSFHKPTPNDFFKTAD